MNKISIIVPVYNVEQYVERCVRSLVEQTYPNIEILLINDGSKDRSLEVINKLALKDERITVINKENGGLGQTRNYGIQKATGDYLCFIDSDDWIVEDYLTYAMEVMQRNNAQIVSCAYHFTKGSVELPTQIVEDQVYTKVEALREYTHVGIAQSTNDYSACTKLYKKELFEGIKFPENQLFEDMATNFQLIQKCHSYVKSTKYVYYYFENPMSITRSGFKMKDFDLEKVAHQMIELGTIEQDSLLMHNLMIKKDSVALSLLVKMAKYGFEDEIENPRKIVKEYTKRLRHSLKTLLGSELSMARKGIAIILCIHFNCLALPLKIKREGL